MTTAPCLLVRYDPTKTDVAIEETRRVMTRVGEPDAIVRTTRVPGTLKVQPEGDPHEAQDRIRALVDEDPRLFENTTRWTVVDEWVPTDLQSIRKAVAPFTRHIGATDSWKVHVRHSMSDLHKQMVIDAVAPLVQNAPVDLEHPAKEIRIDILGEDTAVGFLRGDETIRIHDHKPGHGPGDVDHEHGH